MPPSTAESQRERRLRQLLRLKSHERPGPEFWESFEGDFRRELVRRTVAPRKGVFGSGLISRWALPTLALLMATSFIWIGSGERNPGSEGTGVAVSGEELSLQPAMVQGVLPSPWQEAPVYEIVSTQYVVDSLRFQPSVETAPVENRLSRSIYVSDPPALQDGLRSGTAVIR